MMKGHTTKSLKIESGEEIGPRRIGSSEVQMIVCVGITAHCSVEDTILPPAEYTNITLLLLLHSMLFRVRRGRDNMQ